MKKTIAMVLSLTLMIGALCSFGSPKAVAASAPSVRVNGYLVTFTDASPYIDSNSRTMMPLRAVTEALGATVTWDGDTQTVEINKNNISVYVKIDSTNLRVVDASAETSTITMDTVAVLDSTQGRTYVPIRFVAQGLGAWVGYSEYYSTVQIWQDQLTPTEIDRLHSYYDMSYAENAKANGTYNNLVALGSMPSDDQTLINRYSGIYGINNAMEACIRNDVGICTPSITSIKNFQDYVSGLKMTPSANTTEEYAHSYATNATDIISDLYDPAGKGKVDVTFRTDSSCVFRSKYIENNAVRGICSLTFASDWTDYDNYVANTFQTKALPFMPVAGKTYTFDAEFFTGGDTFYSIDGSVPFNEPTIIRLWTDGITDLGTMKVVKMH